MPATTAQPAPAEGPRDDEFDGADRGEGEGVSAQTPAEGGDELPAATGGSARLVYDGEAHPAQRRIRALGEPAA